MLGQPIRRSGRSRAPFTIAAGQGLISTFDPEIAATHQAAGWEAHDTVVPVLTLTKVLEDRGSPTIHFLKIDVEGAEAEVLEGLNLDRVRPWIIVVEATEPFSTTSTRDKWELFITGHKYGFAYFDGLNCFYVANEVSELKQRLTTPPNVFDGFVRFPEWSSGQKAAALSGLERAFQTEQAHSADLRRALKAEQAHSADLRRTLEAEQANFLERTGQLEAELAVRYHYRGVFGSLREIGDRMTGGGLRSLTKQTRALGDQITGGGLRSLAKRFPGALVRWAVRQRALLAVGRTILKPFPKVTTSLYRLATTPDAIGTPLLPQPGVPSDRQLPSEGSEFPPGQGNIGMPVDSWNGVSSA